MRTARKSSSEHQGPVFRIFWSRRVWRIGWRVNLNAYKTNGVYIESISISPQLTQNCYITPCPYILLHSLKDALQRKQWEPANLVNTTYTGTSLVCSICAKLLTFPSSKIQVGYSHFLTRLCRNAAWTKGYSPHEIAQLQFTCKILLVKVDVR